MLKRGSLFVFAVRYAACRRHNRAVDFLAGGGTASSAGSHWWQFSREGSSGQCLVVWPSSIVSPLSANDSFLFQGGMNKSVTSAAVPLFPSFRLSSSSSDHSQKAKGELYLSSLLCV